jgi:hypothetical protein
MRLGAHKPDEVLLRHGYCLTIVVYALSARKQTASFQNVEVACMAERQFNMENNMAVAYQYLQSGRHE